MANIGELKIAPSEAIGRANDIRSTANRIEEVLTSISKAMDEIDDEGTGIYQGTNKSRELKEKLEIIRTNFEPIYKQIMAFANQIDVAASTASNQ